MRMKTKKPITPGQRWATVASFQELTTDKPYKPLTVALRSKGGRNSNGRVTMRYRGGGHKRRLRLIDFKRDKFDIPATVLTIEYDPNRSARLALIQYEDDEKAYILAAAGMKEGSRVISSLEKIEIKLGNRMPLEFIQPGTMVYNVELQPGKGGVMARSAGSGVAIQAVEGKFAQLKMPSTEIRLVKKNVQLA